ncbi:DNA replication and repair protein RecO [Tenacibaculum sp. MAR_2009_124]|uniref:DNA repair protein RecO n=1 Tax=Tenacibaculum sp. MAR_2009_124 TaxID=1250059 RepID=UPI0008964175|nr:DNA repair protein RecO [Tenacibaculum sp. MAR_2009_124]SEC52751.1 DNA replication and repair protein RecO [Tenacibaculum sp. MAR_2009_124]
MPIVNTKAIVFGAIKYGDTSLIVKCFTLEDGVKSYMVKGVLSSKKGKLKTAYFQPLTQLQMVANHNHKNTLNSIKEARVVHLYRSMHTSIVKQTIAMFLSEILSSIIQEEEKNPGLYIYIETALLWLDSHDEISNFHLVFLMNLSRFLGFYPDTANMGKKGFNLAEGSFTDSEHENLTLYNVELILFKRVLGINFDAINAISLNKNERQIILKTIIKYFELHLDGFRKPKSLDILETVFN